jgi:two-component system, chemotaxis family, protein-glutamate methylesterase/glutaminase
VTSSRASGERPTVVAIAASTGGLNAVSAIIEALPRDFQASTVVVLHLSEGGRGLLPPILSARTSLRVVEPAGGERLRAGWIYTAAPGRHLLVGPHRTLRVSDAAQVNNSRPSADPLFESLAAHPELRAIAVILTGRDGDGSRGLPAISTSGGVVIVQDPETAECADMPRSAIATGLVNYILPLAGIAPKIVELVNEQSE